MQKNELSPSTLPQCRTPELDVRQSYLNELPFLKTSSEALTSSGVNRDSGIFEDLFSFQLKDDFSTVGDSPTRDFFAFDHSLSDKALDEDLNLTSNSDRVLHASLSSLNTEVDLSPSLSSLSFDSSTEEEDSEEEEEIIERVKEGVETESEEEQELVEIIDSKEGSEEELFEREEEESEEEAEDGLVEKNKEELFQPKDEEEESETELDESIEGIRDESEEELFKQEEEEDSEEEDKEEVVERKEEKVESKQEDLVRKEIESEDEQKNDFVEKEEEEDSEEEKDEEESEEEKDEEESEEEKDEDELLELEEQEEEEFDELISNNDTSISSDSDDLSDSDSSSFGYHSLLNDASPDEGTLLSPDIGKLSDNDDSDNEIINEETKPTLNSTSEYQEYDSASLDLTDCDNLSISQELLQEEETKELECNLNKDQSLSSSSLSVSISSFSSEDESPSDIENKMAETQVKMNDSHLSNGREELAIIHSRKMKQYMRAKDLQNVLGEVHSHRPNFKDKTFVKNNVLYNNNNNNYKQLINQSRHADKQRFRPPSSLPMKNKMPEKDNRMSTSEDSPIIDAYEKECQDAPEKSVREIEKQAMAKENIEMLQKKQGMTKKNEELKKYHTEIEEQDEADMKAFELAMKQAIQKKEAESHSLNNITFDFDDIDLRHRPSPQQRRRERNALRRGFPQASHSLRDRNKQKSPDVCEFDVYTMETALPKIDWETIEAHLQATKEEERRRRTDREEIRRKLAMGTDEESFNDGISKKPSLQSRLQNGKNLQICFMNETASDCESQCSDTESTQDRIDEMEGIISQKEASKMTENEMQSMDFGARQAKLQAEARLALSQAKEMARMQMEIEKQSQKKSPITEIIKDSFNKIGFPFPAGKRRMSRQLLTDINVAQLQVIVNDLHTQIEILNEDLVQMLLSRDDLHMEQDSMLVDIEDLTKHLGAQQGPNAILNTNGMSKSLPSPTNHLKFSHSAVTTTRSLKLRMNPRK